MPEHPSTSPGADEEAVAVELIERDAWLDLFDAASPAVVQALGLARSSQGGTGLLACRTVPITELNRAMAIGVGAVADDAAIEAATAWLDGHAAPGWAVQLSRPASGNGLDARLAAKHLVAQGAGWVKFTRRTGEGGLGVADDTHLRAVTRAEAELYGDTVQKGFGLPPETAAWFAALPERAGWHCYLAFVDAAPAGAGALFVRDGAAWMGIGTTLSAYRGTGVQGRLVAKRVAAAGALGARLITSETGNPPAQDAPGFSSYRNLVRAGFEPSYVRPNLKRV